MMLLRRRLPTFLVLLAVCLLSAGAFPGVRAQTVAPPALVEGRDYVLIPGGQPAMRADGRIEVAEVFSYSCVHCAHFEPLLSAWKARQRSDVRLVYVPLPLGVDDALALGFFAATDAGLQGRTHAQAFRAVHQTGTLPRNPSIDEMAAWYGTQGGNAARLAAAMRQPGMRDRLAAAYAFARRSGIEGTPTLIIAGRYRILGGSFQDKLRIADQLIAQLRRR